MKNTQENGNLAVHLYENALSLKKDEYFGKITQRGSRTTAELAEELADSDIGLSREQLIRASSGFADLALAYVADGFSVKLDTGTLRAGISGVFKGAAAQFDPTVNTVSVCFSPSQKTRQVIKTALIVVKGLASNPMVINRVFDVKSGEENGSLTIGRNLKIFGSRLTIEGDDPRVGVWFVSAIDETVRVPIEDGDLVDNNPSQLTIIIPQLTEGEWFAEIVTQSTSSKGTLLKDIRTARFDQPLTVL